MDPNQKMQTLNMDRREFLSAVCATSLGICAGETQLFAETREKLSTGRQTYKHRVQFGAWINDMRNEVLPRDNWPAKLLDEKTEKDIVNCLALGAQAGYNQLDVWGLFATSAYPIDLRSAFRDKARRPRVDRILKAARDRGIKIIFGLGVYSWGFDEIIKQNPAVQGPNKHAMCGAAPESLEWQKKLIDVIVSELHVDGFHLESADQGRCTCSKCMPLGNVEYHSQINLKTADHIRSKYPDKLVSCIIQGWSTWGKDFTDAEKEQLVDLSRHVDVIWDQGHRQTYVPREKRKEFIASLHCDYGTSGGFWVYPPPRWDRLRWFFPYVDRTGQHIKELYAQGGRGVMFYQGPIINPSVEANLAFGGRILSDASRDTAEVLAQVLGGLYRPRNAAAHRKLVDIFLKPEQAYFSNWQVEEIEKVHKAPPPGELHLGPLFGTSPGGPAYLGEPFLNQRGRRAYKESLLSAYDELVACGEDFRDQERIQRIKQCIVNAVADIDTLSMGKNQPV